MPRYRKRKSGGGGGGEGMTGVAAPLIANIFGAVMMLIALILFGIGLSSLDTAYTAAATYTEQVGLTDIMGIFALVIFLVVMGVGIAALGAGSVMSWRRAQSGGWMGVFMAFVMGVVGLVIALLLNTIIQGQLHTVYTTAANASETVNIAQFAGLLDVMTIWGMIIFISLIASGITGIVGAGVGGYKTLRAKM